MKKIYVKYLLLLYASMYAFTFLTSQNLKPCGTTEMIEKLYEENPQLKKNFQKLLEDNKSFIMKKDGTTETVYTIPVVFHIIHEYGSENISDDQVYDQMDILNRDFRGLNGDTTEVVPEFQNLIADSRIQFKLANFDVYGNCTNGIEHIHSHETNIGNDYSKLNIWSPNRYLNVWVTKKIGASGAAGYAYYPSAVTGLGFFRDGIIILHNYIGSVGTSSENTSRALTHEIGHFLGLRHVWGDSNEPGVACGDDGIEDTPITKGYSSCNLSNSDICNPGIVENVQNYMEYSYCSKMFTLDQAAHMEATLNNNTAYRKNLWSSGNLEVTGTNTETPVLCPPVADFSAAKKYVCQDELVAFKNASWQATVDQYKWSFPGGTPSTSNEMSPVVTYNTPGWKEASLEVTNAAGSDKKTIQKYIYVSPPEAQVVNYLNDAFEGSSVENWIVDNPEENEARFSLVEGVGYNGSKCFRLNNFTNSDWESDPFNLYFNRLGGNKDALISPSCDLSNLDEAYLSFKFAYASMATNINNITEILRIYASKDCGKNWALIDFLKGLDLSRHGSEGEFYIPSSNLLWNTHVIEVPTSLLDPNVRFKFEMNTEDWSNNLYIDDVEVGIALSTNKAESPQFVMTIFPQPCHQNDDLRMGVQNNGMDLSLKICDLLGNMVVSQVVPAFKGREEFVLNQSRRLTPGAYTVSISDGTHEENRKIIVY